MVFGPLSICERIAANLGHPKPCAIQRLPFSGIGPLIDELFKLVSIYIYVYRVYSIYIYVYIYI